MAASRDMPFSFCCSTCCRAKPTILASLRLYIGVRCWPGFAYQPVTTQEVCQPVKLPLGPRLQHCQQRCNVVDCPPRPMPPTIVHRKCQDPLTRKRNRANGVLTPKPASARINFSRSGVLRLRVIAGTPRRPIAAVPACCAAARSTASARGAFHLRRRAGRKPCASPAEHER